MSLHNISLGKLAIILIVAGVGIVFLISGFQARDVLFASNVTEETSVIIKDEQGTCTVQAEDDVPRIIENCPYNVGDTISITYKREQPSISEHHLIGEQ
jgi:Na+-transporting methylmalonyl-CoA/oxaloacetate decarboxylase gamma subunit